MPKHSDASRREGRGSLAAAAAAAAAAGHPGRVIPEDCVLSTISAILFDDMTQRLCTQVEEYDDEYTDMLKTFWPAFEKSLTKEHGAQDPKEVADVIMNVLTAAPEQRHFRNVTSRLARDFLRPKYADIEGDKTLRHIEDFIEKVWHVPHNFVSVPPIQEPDPNRDAGVVG